MSKYSAVIELLDNFSGLATVCCKPGYEGYGEMRKKEQESLDVLLYSAYLAYKDCPSNDRIDHYFNKLLKLGGQILNAFVPFERSVLYGKIFRPKSQSSVERDLAEFKSTINSMIKSLLV